MNEKSLVTDPDYSTMYADGIIFVPDDNMMYRLVFYQNETEIEDNKILSDKKKKNLLFEVRIPYAVLGNIFKIAKEHTSTLELVHEFDVGQLKDQKNLDAITNAIEKLQTIVFDTENPTANKDKLSASRLYLIDKIIKAKENAKKA